MELFGSNWTTRKLPRKRLSCVVSYLVPLSIYLACAIPVPGQSVEHSYDPSGNLILQLNENTVAPQITRQPQGQVVGLEDAASFFVLATPSDVVFQWRYAGTNIAGATNDVLFFSNVSASNEGPYSVVVSNSFGSVTSSVAQLYLDTDDDELPDSWEITYFGSIGNQITLGDPDGDNMSNLDEFRYSTDPTNNLSGLSRLTVITDGRGTVEVSPSRLFYTNGEPVILTAIPFTSPVSSAFRGWSGGSNTLLNPLTVIMNGNRTAMAHFSPANTTNISWNGEILDGSWHSSECWHPPQVDGTNVVPARAPGIGDSASINSTNPNVSISREVECESLALGNPTNGPTLAGPGDLFLYQGFNWRQGTMGGSGRTWLGPGVNLVLDDPYVLYLARTLENAGTIICQGIGNRAIAPGGRIINEIGGLFRADAGSTFIALPGGAGGLENYGTFRKGGTGPLTFTLTLNNYNAAEIPEGTTTFASTFNNHGTLTLSSNTTVEIAGSGSSSGTINNPSSSVVGWPVSQYTFSPGTKLSGTGLYRINGCGVFCDATLAVENVQLSAGFLGGSGVVTVNGLMDWSGGDMVGNGGTTIIASGATLDIANAATISLSNRRLENAGSVNWNGVGSFQMVSAVISNRVGALITVQNNSTFSWGGGTPRIDNAGTFRRSSGAGTLAFTVALNNYGTVELQTGTFQANGAMNNNGNIILSANTTNRISGGGTSSGTFMNSPGSLVEWANSHTLSPGAQLDGAGTYRIAVAPVSFNATLSVQNLEVVSGALSGNGTVTVGNSLNWVGGDLSGGGRVIVAPTAVLNLVNSGTVALNKALENGGTVLWTGTGNCIAIAAIITNRTGALFEVQNNASLSWGGGPVSIENAGTFRRSVGTGTFATMLPFNNYGTLDIRCGIVSINSTFNAGPASEFRCALGGTTAGTGYGQLQVISTATLAGALNVDLLPGYTPAVNDTFTVLSAGGRSGAFTSFSYPSNRVTMVLSNAPTSVVLRVTEVLPVPQPVLLTPEIVGTNARLIWTATSNVTYRLEFNPDLSPSNWNAVSGDVTTLSNTASKLDLLTPSNRLYRVRVLP